MPDYRELKKAAAFKEISELVAREGGLLHLLFDVEYPPVLLPDGLPPEIVSAWCRLLFGAAKDINLIEKWLNETTYDEH